MTVKKFPKPLKTKKTHVDIAPTKSYRIILKVLFKDLKMIRKNTDLSREKETLRYTDTSERHDYKIFLYKNLIFHMGFTARWLVVFYLNSSSRVLIKNTLKVKILSTHSLLWVLTFGD